MVRPHVVYQQHAGSGPNRCGKCAQIRADIHPIKSPRNHEWLIPLSHNARRLGKCTFVKYISAEGYGQQVWRDCIAG